MPALVRALCVADEELQDNSLAALARIVGENPSARDTLLGLASSRDQDVRRAAQRALEFVRNALR